MPWLASRPNQGDPRSLDLIPFLAHAGHGFPKEGLESLKRRGGVAVATNDRVLLRALCRSCGVDPHINGTVNDQKLIRYVKVLALAIISTVNIR